MAATGPIVCVTTSAVAAGATVLLLGRIWQTCDIGVNAAANGSALVLLYLPAVFAVALAASGGVYALARSFGGATVLAGSGAVIVAGLVGWLTLWQFHGGDYPSDCAAGVPPWWPGWIPL